MCAQRKAAVDFAGVAKRVLRRYPRKCLVEALEKFDYRVADSPENNQKWKSFRQRASMTLEELQDLSRWKTGGRQDLNIARNSAESVCAVTRAAIAVASEVPDEPALPIGVLTALHGVHIPTASTVMTVWDPERFAILDIYAWKALCTAVPDDFPSVQSPAGNRRLFRLAEADLYLRVIREIAQRASLTYRAVDQALWVLGEKK